MGSDDSFDFLKDPWCDDPKILFDGVRGELPEWMPENYHSELHATRSCLQNYSYDDLLKFVTEVHDYWKGVNVTFSAPLEIHQEIIKLEYFQEVVSLGEKAGLTLLMGSKHASLVKQGTDYIMGQSEKASKPRGKVSEYGETTDEIIGKLALANEHKEESAKELWPHFLSKLDEKGCDPKLKEKGVDSAKWVCEYDSKSGRRTISLGRFSTVVSMYRAKKKSR